jgi:hypothetical protein
MKRGRVNAKRVEITENRGKKGKITAESVK